jgi:hypothetical protein
MDSHRLELIDVLTVCSALVAGAKMGLEEAERRGDELRRAMIMATLLGAARNRGESASQALLAQEAKVAELWNVIILPALEQP